VTVPQTGAGPATDRAALRGLAPTERDAKGRVRHGALTDPLTELPNRLHFDVVYRLLWEAGGRGIPITLIRIEVPGFGSSSEEGQRRIGQRMNLITRQMDMVARLEQDQFGLILMDCNAFGGMVAAERFHADLAPILQDLQLSFHAGIAAWKDWMAKADDMTAAADEALAAARALGPGRIEIHHR
jgi:GGDEF domain-containing protein